MYGIWNSVDKRFVFGIREATQDAAWKKFVGKAGKTSYKWRFKIKKYPEGFRNKPNPHYKKRELKKVENY